MLVHIWEVLRLSNGEGGFDSRQARHFRNGAMTRKELSEMFQAEYDSLYKEFEDGVISLEEYNRQKKNLDLAYSDDLETIIAG